MGIFKSMVINGYAVPTGHGVEVAGLIDVIGDMTVYIADRDREETQLIERITEAMSLTAQQFSPYLTGTLRASHRTEVKQLSGEQGTTVAVGIVHIDPNAWNYITQGAPYIYGQEIHISRNPWFGFAIQAGAESIVQAQGAILVDWWEDTFPGN